MKSKGEKTVLTAADYRQWIVELKTRYRATQIKAAVAVNSALIEFYWNLGKDISEKYPGEVYGGKFFEKLGADLQQALPGVRGFLKVNLIYCRQFFELYGGMEIVPQLVEQLIQIPWGHHRTLIDKCKGDRAKALFYVRRTIQNGWSRNTLLNWLSTDLYKCEGKVKPESERGCADTLQACPIVPDKSSLSPENALCLAATYAAAFKNHLITFDEDMRLVLSPSLSEHATGDAFRHTFKAYEGQRMLPARYIQPSDAMMRVHREALVA